jgi:hypothetical protein
MRPAAILPHFEIARAAIFMFYVEEREVRCAPSFAAKMLHRHEKKSSSGRYLFFTFPRLRVTWGDLGIGAPR